MRRKLFRSDRLCVAAFVASAFILGLCGRSTARAEPELRTLTQALTSGETEPRISNVLTLDAASPFGAFGFVIVENLASTAVRLTKVRCVGPCQVVNAAIPCPEPEPSFTAQARDVDLNVLYSARGLPGSTLQIPVGYCDNGSREETTATLIIDAEDLDGKTGSVEVTLEGIFSTGTPIEVSIDGPSELAVARRGTYTATVKNRTLSFLTDIALRIERDGPALSIFSNPNPTQGMCDASAADLLFCELGELPPRGSTTVEFELLSLGVETVGYTASATGNVDGEPAESNEASLSVEFKRCIVETIGVESAEFGQGVQLLVRFSGAGTGDVDFEFSVNEPGGILARERSSEDEFLIIVAAIERPGIVEVKVTATRGSCTAETTHTIAFPSKRAPERAGDRPQEPGRDDGDAAATQKSPPCSVFLHTGENRHDRTDLVIPGRGDVHFAFNRRYRSQVRFDGPLGHNWDFTYNESLIELPDGSVVRVNGRGHVDAWRRNEDGSYASPRGFFSTLAREADGSFVLREPDGFKRVYDASGRLRAHEDRSSNRLSFEYDGDGNLDFVVDAYGRIIDFIFSNGRLARIRDFVGREVVYSYDDNGDLVAVRTPIVTGTSTGNDFPQGRTERYVYSSGFDDPDLDHNLLQVVRPEEFVAGGPPALVWTYGTDPLDRSTFDRVRTQSEGGTNASRVPAGGTTSFSYEALNANAPPGDLTLPRLKATVIDRKGNASECFFNERSQHIRTRELTRGVREGDPEAFETSYEYDEDDQLVRVVMPLGNEIRYRYDRMGPRSAHRNVIEIRRIADPARGGGEDLITTMTYEPLFNRVATITDPRGNSPDFEPPIGVSSRERYTWKFFYDYQEGSAQLSEAAKFGIDLTGVPRGFGDLNGDGRTDQAMGNRIRAVAPQVELLPESREAERLGGPVQEIIAEARWNDHGQKTAEIDPEGNVLLLSYYAADDPDGDGVRVPAPRSNDESGYLRSVTVDADSSPRRRSASPPVALETRFRYDAVGNVTGIRNPRGVVTEIELNQLNEPVVIVRGAEISDAVASGELVTGEEAFRYRVRFFYDRNGRVVRDEVENRDSSTPGVGDFVERRFTYDILDRTVERRVEVDAETTLVWTIRYDPSELPALLVEPEGNQHAFEHDERDLPFAVIRGFGSAEESRSELGYDANGNLVEITDAEDSDGDGEPESMHRIYDGFDRLVEIVDPLGNRLVEEYDVNSNVVRRRALGHGPSFSSGQGEPEGGLPDEVLLADAFFRKDELDRTYQIDEALFLAPGFEPSRPVNLVDGDGDGFITTRFEFDRSSRSTLAVEDDGQASQTIYDGADRVVLFRDARGNEISIDYDRGSNPIRVRELEKASDGIVLDVEFTTTRVYDQLDRLVRESDNIGETVRISYDSRDLVTVTSDAEGDLLADPLGLVPQGINAPGNTRRFFHDGLGRVVREIIDLREEGRGGRPLDVSNPENPDGLITLEYIYDGNSRLIETRDDNGNRTAFAYDALNRRISQTNADGGEFRYSYDRDNHLIEWTDPAGSAVTNTFDARDRLIERTIERAAGVEGTTREVFGYDGLSRLTYRGDDNGRDEGLHAVEYIYDSLSRILEEKQSLSGGVSAEPTGFIRGDCNADGSTSGVSDAIFLLGFNFLGGARPTCLAACDSNGDGRTGGVSDAIYLLSFNFLGMAPPPPPFPACGSAGAEVDCASYPPCSRQGGGAGAGRVGIVSSVWSGDGKRLSVTYPGGRTITSTFDSVDRIRSLSDGGAELAAFSFIGPGRRELVRRLGNGTSETLLDSEGSRVDGYDAAKRVTKKRYLFPDEEATFLDRRYTYNRSDMLTSIERRDDGDLADSVIYDSLYRIVRSEFDGGGGGAAIRRDVRAIDYLLDGAGNRRLVSAEDAAGTTSDQPITVNDVHEYTSVGAIERAHDLNGNVVDDGARLFTYDYKNRLVRATDKTTGDTISEYTYHADGRRATKTVFAPGEAGAIARETVFFYDGWRVCEEGSAEGATETTYVWGPFAIDDLIEIERASAHPAGAGKLYAHQDVTGNVVALTGPNGAVVEKRFYDDFGKAFDEAKQPSDLADSGVPYGFQGRRFDPETGLYYFRHRTYDPALGRFLERDPVADSANVGNSYSYAANSPLSRGDPSGLLSFEWSEDYPFSSLSTGGPITWLLDSIKLDPPPERKRDDSASRTEKPSGPKSPLPGKGGISQNGIFSPFELETREDAITACRMMAMVDLIMGLQGFTGATPQAAEALSGAFPQPKAGRLASQWLGREPGLSAPPAGRAGSGRSRSPSGVRAGSEAPTETDLPAVPGPIDAEPIGELGSWTGSKHVVIAGHGTSAKGGWRLGHSNVMLRTPPNDVTLLNTTGRTIDSGTAPSNGARLPLRYLGADANAPHLYVDAPGGLKLGNPQSGTILRTVPQRVHIKQIVDFYANLYSDRFVIIDFSGCTIRAGASPEAIQAAPTW